MTARSKARLLGIAVALAGLVNIVSALTPALHSRFSTLRELLTPLSANIADGATAVLGVCLLLLGRGIMQRKRVAHHAAIGVLLISTFTHIAKGLDAEEAALTAVLALTLFLYRRLFIVGPEPLRWHGLARAVVYVIGLDFAVGVAGLYLRSHLITPHLTPVRALEEVGSRLIGMSGPLQIRGRFGTWFPLTLTVFGGMSLLYLLMRALSPVAERGLAHHDERDEVRTLIQRRDGDTLDPFALRTDKRYVFSSDGRAAVAYRYVNGVGLASGDPVGDPDCFRDAFSRFLELCDSSGWKPAVLGARADRVPLYESLGLKGIYIGDEALIDVPQFSLEGRRMRNVRQSAAHTSRAGVTTEVHREGQLDPTLRRALIGISDRDKAGAPERGFSMALDALLSGRDPDNVLVVCRDAGGAPIAFQRYVPCKAGNGLSLDAMRRDPEAPGGVNERMIIDAVEWARSKDIAEVSLNFAAFREILEGDAQLSFLQTISAWILRRVPSYIQIDQLRRFNKKFRPRWVPRYVIYRSPADIPALGIAFLNAEAMLPFQKREHTGPPGTPVPAEG